MTRIAEAATTASRGDGGRLIIITRRARAGYGRLWCDGCGGPTGSRVKWTASVIYIYQK